MEKSAPATELPLENPLPESLGSSKIRQLMPRHSFIFINQSMSFTMGELMDTESRAGRDKYSQFSLGLAQGFLLLCLV